MHWHARAASRVSSLLLCINMKQLFQTCVVFAAAAMLRSVLVEDCCLDHGRQPGVGVGEAGGSV
jgi:hypothetical protein